MSTTQEDERVDLVKPDRRDGKIHACLNDRYPTLCGLDSSGPWMPLKTFAPFSLDDVHEVWQTLTCQRCVEIWSKCAGVAALKGESDA